MECLCQVAETIFTFDYLALIYSIWIILPKKQKNTFDKLKCTN